MRISAIDAVGQTIRIGDRVAYAQSGTLSGIHSTVVDSFTEHKVRVHVYDRPATVSSSRLIKLEQQYV